MLTLELSSYVLEIPNDAYTTLSRNLIGCSTLSQEYCKLIGWYWEKMRRQLWTLTCPIRFYVFNTWWCIKKKNKTYVLTIWHWMIWMDGWIYYYHRQHNTMMSRNSVLILVQKVKKCPGIQSLLFKKVHCLKHVLNCVGNYLFPTWFYI